MLNVQRNISKNAFQGGLCEISLCHPGGIKTELFGDIQNKAITILFVVKVLLGNGFLWDDYQRI